MSTDGTYSSPSHPQEWDELLLQALERTSLEEGRDAQVSGIMDLLSELTAVLPQEEPPAALKQQVMASIDGGAPNSSATKTVTGTLSILALLPRLKQLFGGTTSAPNNQIMNAGFALGISSSLVIGGLSVGSLLQRIDHINEQDLPAPHAVVSDSAPSVITIEEAPEYHAPATSALSVESVAQQSNEASENNASEEEIYAGNLLPTELDPNAYANFESLAELEKAAKEIPGVAPKQDLNVGAPHNASHPFPLNKAVRTFEEVQTNYRVAQAYLYFASTKDKLSCTLSATAASSGTGEILWDDRHSDALMKVSNLEKTDSNSHYAVYYVLHDGTTQRMFTFATLSAAHQGFFLRFPPGPRVVSVKVVLESSNAVPQDILVGAVTPRRPAREKVVNNYQ